MLIQFVIAYIVVGILTMTIQLLVAAYEREYKYLGRARIAYMEIFMTSIAWLPVLIIVGALIITMGINKIWDRVKRLCPDNIKEKVHNKLYNLTMWLEGEQQDQCQNCPLSWEVVGLEDRDAGCNVDGWDKTVIWCRLPRWVRKIKQKKIDKKEEEYFEQMAKDMIERENKRICENCCYVDDTYDEQGMPIMLCENKKSGKHEVQAEDTCDSCVTYKEVNSMCE